jgi:nucleotide-binding universal stress UspA family protein
MKKILVTTDFSQASKAGLRFAIQMARQAKFELVFFHCFQALIPSSLHRKQLEDSAQEQLQSKIQKLEKFVADILKPTGVHLDKYRCVVVEDLNPEAAILQYAKEASAAYICISTRGAGTLLKIIGTNTSKIIVKSPVPVLVIPHTYRVRPLKKVLYASDLENFEQEMPIVADFAQFLNVKADLAHFYYPAEMKLDRETLAEMWRKKYPALEHVYFEQHDLDAGFVAQMGQMAQKVKPGLVSFFTHSNQTWFAKFFSPNHTEAFSFVTKTPMLVHKKWDS